MAQATTTRTVAGPLQGAAQPTLGWQRFETEQLELWLPGSYLGGDPRLDLRGIFERPELAAVFQAWKAEPDSPELGEEEWRRRLGKVWCKKMKKDEGPKQHFFAAFNTETDGGHVLTVEVVVLRMKLALSRRRVPLHKHVSAAVGEFATERAFSMCEHSIVQLGPYEAGRLVTEVAEAKSFRRTGAPVARHLWYVIKGKKELWIIRYCAPIDAWDRQLPVFEKSAATLRLQGVDVA